MITASAAARNTRKHKLQQQHDILNKYHMKIQDILSDIDDMIDRVSNKGVSTTSYSMGTVKFDNDPTVRDVVLDHVAAILEGNGYNVTKDKSKLHIRWDTSFTIDYR